MGRDRSDCRWPELRVKGARAREPHPLETERVGLLSFQERTLKPHVLLAAHSLLDRKYCCHDKRSWHRNVIPGYSGRLTLRPTRYPIISLSPAGILPTS